MHPLLPTTTYLPNFLCRVAANPWSSSVNTTFAQPAWLAHLLAHIAKSNKSDPHIPALQHLSALVAWQPAEDADHFAVALKLEIARHMLVVELIKELIPTAQGKRGNESLAKLATKVADFHAAEAERTRERLSRIGSPALASDQTTRYATVPEQELDKVYESIRKVVESRRHALRAAERSRGDANAESRDFARAEGERLFADALRWIAQRNNANPTAFDKFTKDLEGAWAESHLAHNLKNATMYKGKLEREARLAFQSKVLATLATLLELPAAHAIAA
jgi:regulator of protease activity HflC (stomatin/prohibitin superfamily)